MSTNPAIKALQLILIFFATVMGISAMFSQMHSGKYIILATVCALSAAMFSTIESGEIVKSEAIDDEGTYKQYDPWSIVLAIQIVGIVLIALSIFLLPHVL